MKVLKRFSDILIFCGVWALFRSVPFFLVEGYTDELELHHRYEGGLTLVAIACLIPILWAIEALLCLTLYSFFSQLRHRLLRISALSSLSVLILAYFSLQIASWLLYQQTGFFSTLDSLQLASVALDIRVLLSTITGSDLARFFLLPCFALIPFSILVVAHHVNEYRLTTKRNIAVLVLTLTILIAAPRLHFNNLTPKRLRFFQSLLHNFLSPDMSLVWGPLWVDSPLPEFERVPLDLEKIDVATAYKPTAPEQLKKNILVISVEALRADILRAYGGEKSVMPFVDSLSNEAIVFKRAYAQGAETAYSQTTIVSSLHPLKFPYRDVGKDLNYPIARVHDILSDLGYQTAHVTEEWSSTSRFTKSEKLDLFLNPAVLSRSELRKYLPDEKIKTNKAGVPTAATNDRVKLAALKKWLQAIDSERPFFASLYLVSSHYPFNPPEGFTPPFSPYLLGENKSAISFLGYSKKFATVMKNRYMNTLHFIDQGIRSLFDTLASTGKLENTIIFITGDHGSLFHEHGLVNHAGYLYEEVSRVPLLVLGADDYFPVDEGLSPVGHIDITPTILGVLGLPPHPNHQGEALLYGEKPAVSLMNRPLFSTVQLVIQEDCILLWPWKYCFNWREQSERLFQLDTDPKEGNNRVTEDPSKAASMKEALHTFRNRQLTYYSPMKTYRLHYYPPKIKGVATNHKNHGAEGF